MMRRKNLERAVVLGLLLSTSVYGSVWAEPKEINHITDSFNGEYSTSVIVKDDSNTSAIEINDKEVSITTTNYEDGIITLESGKYGIRLEGESNVILTAAQDNKIIVDLGSEDDADGISAVNGASGKINLIANGSNIITTTGVGTDGIYTDKGNNTEILLNAANDNHNNEIYTGNNGIDHRGNNKVTLTAKGGNIIDAGNAYTTVEGDGIRIEGNGNVELNAQYNKITASDEGLYIHNNSGENVEIELIASGTDENGYGNYINANDNGIEITKGTANVTANAGANYVYGEKNAVYNHGSGTITISATAGTSDEGVSTLANYDNYDNELVGGINGVQSDSTGTTNVIADNNNIIAGTENGILSDGTGTITVTAGNNNTIGQYTDESGKVVTSENGIYVTKGTVNITAENGDNNIYANNSGIYLLNDTEINVTTKNGNINIKNESGSGVSANTNANINLSAGNDIIINSVATSGIATADNNGIFTNGANSNITAGGNMFIMAVADKSASGLEASVQVSNPAATLNIDVEKILSIYAEGERAYGISLAGLKSSEINAAESIYVTAVGKNDFDTYAYHTSGISSKLISDGDINLTMNLLSNKYDYGSASTVLTDKNAGDGIDDIVTISGKNVNINAVGRENAAVQGVYNAFYKNDANDKGSNTLEIKATENVEIISNTENGNSRGIYTEFADTNIKANNITVKAVSESDNARSYGIVVEQYTDGWLDIDNASNVNLHSVQNNNVYGADNAIRANLLYDALNKASTNVTLTADNGDNTVGAGTIDDKGFGSGSAIWAVANNFESVGTNVDLYAGNANNIAGAVYAYGTTTSVDVQGINNSGSQYNDIRSAASIANAGGLTNTTVISALYAEAGAQINVSGENNTILSYADYDKPEILERAVWAYDRADITIDGATTISTDSYEKSSNSNDIAIAAGTGTGLTEEIVSAPVADRSTVTLTYNNYANGAKSNITGNILSAYTGTVDIKGVNDSAGIDVTGDLLAGNNGELNLNLGNGGILKGRADDYGDAGVVNNGHANTFKDPAFSSEIHKGGVVNLTMGDNSRWNVTGQSWITSITTDHEEENAEHNHIIDLISANTDRNEAAHALTVYNFDGNAIFNMSLDADRSISDMLYIKNADGNYIINVVDAVTEDDIYAVKSDGGTFDGLRFATVGKGSTASFKAITYDQGFNNIEYMIGTDSYNESDENHHYNGESLDAEKPGDETVDEFFKNEGTPGSTTESTNGIATASLMLAAANEAGNAAAGTTAEADDLTDVEVNTDETTNFKLIGVKNTDLSDGGETILNMSRANYSNAIYMDRLNKRLGEARYINDDPEEDEGMWVRIRHDRIGKDDAFRSQNTMYQLGYDKRQECDNGERRVGFVVDYMHGDTGYTDIAGKGEIDRYGLWLYDTWMGDKGHYADYIAKWGHLDNDFEIYAPTTRQRIDGDYSNNVFSVSAEYGRKKDIGNDWYFEPQAQLQLARVTGADYTTSQGTKVSVDGINSLIGRAGFRIGKDFGEEKQSTLYFKADVLHEFLGDQDISAMDKTTNGNWSTISYENEGTWYDIGIGYAAMMSKSSYAFIDLEQSFGNDNDDTYQINAGVRWTF